MTDDEVAAIQQVLDRHRAHSPGWKRTSAPSPTRLSLRCPFSRSASRHGDELELLARYVSWRDI